MKNLNLKQKNLPKQLLLNQKSGKKQKNIPRKLIFHLVFLFIYFLSIYILKASKSKAFAQLSIGKVPKKERKTPINYDIEFE